MSTFALAQSGVGTRPSASQRPTAAQRPAAPTQLPYSAAAGRAHVGLPTRQLSGLRRAFTPGSRMRSRGATSARAQDPTKQAQRAADSAKQESQGLLSDLASARRGLLQRGVSLGGIAGQCGVVAVTLAFLFQITHNVGFLPVYDVWAFNLGPFPEAWTIPILLAPIWLLYGYVAPVLDEFVADDATAEAQSKASDLSFVLVCWAALAAQFLFSDLMYQTGQPHWLCSASLAAMAAAIWKKFDGTKQGALLAALLTVGAPAGEMLIVNLLGLWHYARPDLFGVPHWAGWCYATYALGVANVARYLGSRAEQR